MSQIFISYKRDREEFSLTLRDHLRAWGYATWRDIDQILPDSRSWADDIQRGLEGSATVIGVVTGAAMKSENVKAEWDWAIMEGRRLILIWLEDCTFHHQYIRRQRIDFRADQTHGFDLLKAALEQVHHEADANANDPYREYVRAFFERVNTVLRGTLLYVLAEKGDPTPLDLKLETRPQQVIAAKIEAADPMMLRYGLAQDPQTTFDTFAEAFEKLNGRVLLLGNPGAGKTTALLHYARAAAVRRRDDPAAPVPIMANIALWDSQKQTPLAEWLQTSYGAPPDITGLLARGEALLVLDGLDELGSERPVDPQKPEGEKYDPRLRFIGMINRDLPPNNRVLITCRIEDYQQIGVKLDLYNALELQPLSDAQVEIALSGHPALLTAAKRDDELMALFKTPLIMSLFAFAWDDVPAETRAKLENLNSGEALDVGDVRDALFLAYMRRSYRLEEAREKFAGREVPFTFEYVLEKLGELAMVNASGERYWDNRYQNLYTTDNVLLDIDLRYAIGDTAHGFAAFGKRLHCLTSGNSDKEGRPTHRFFHLKLRDALAFVHSLSALRDDDKDVRRSAADALGKIGDVRAVEPLIAALCDADSDVRRRAADALGRIGAVRAVEPLITALRDADSGVRSRAAAALGKIGDARAVEALIAALRDDFIDVINRAADALVKIAAPAVEALIAALRDADWYVRIRATDALDRIGGARAFEGLVAALRDANEDVRRRAAYALSALRHVHAVEPLIVALRDDDGCVRSLATDALERMGEPVVEPLIAALRDNDYVVRRSAAAHALGRIGATHAVEPLIAALRDDDYVVRRSTAHALGAIGDPRAVQPLITALRDDESNVRFSAAAALGAIGDLRAVEPLIAALRDDDATVRSSAATALGKIGDPRAVQPLLTALQDTATDWFNYPVRSSAAYALGAIGDAHAVEPVIAALRDDNGYVRSSAAFALGKIGDPRAVEALITALRDDKEVVRSRATDALGKIGTSSAESLIAALNDTDWRVRYGAAAALVKLDWKPSTESDQIVFQIAKQDWAALVLIGTPAVEPLTAVLGDADKYVRRSAADALGKIGDKRAVEPLIAALRDEDMFVRSSAADALGKIGNARAVEALIAALRDDVSFVRSHAADALVQIGTPAVEALIAALGDSDTIVRRSVAAALGKIGDARAVEALIAARHDDDVYVRSGAADALGAIGDARAVEPLIAALRDNNWGVCFSAADALGRIGDARAVEPLIVLLSDQEKPRFNDRRICDVAAEALERIGTLEALAAVAAWRKREAGGG